MKIPNRKDRTQAADSAARPLQLLEEADARIRQLIAINVQKLEESRSAVADGAIYGALAAKDLRILQQNILDLQKTRAELAQAITQERERKSALPLASGGAEKRPDALASSENTLFRDFFAELDAAYVYLDNDITPDAD